MAPLRAEGRLGLTWRLSPASHDSLPLFPSQIGSFVLAPLTRRVAPE
jgi:hypothetical protein